METWDPKPDAVAQFRGPFGAIRTARARRAVRRTAAASRRRSRTGSRSCAASTTAPATTPRRNHWMLTGFEGPAFNVARLHGAAAAVAWARRWPGCAAPNRPGLPPYVAVPHLRGGTDNFFHYAAYLGGGANPFIVESDPNTPEFRVKNLTPGPGPVASTAWKTAGTSSKRSTSSGAAEDARRPTATPHYQRAFRPADQQARWPRRSTSPPSRRRCATATAGTPSARAPCWPGGWSRRASPSSPSTACRGTTTAPPAATAPTRARKLLIPPLDRAVAALVEDLSQRGLYEKTLVVAMGEFGRTPRMNAEGGRDHWGNVFSVLMGCGAMKMGQVDRQEHAARRVRRRPADQPAGRGRDGVPPPGHRRPQGDVPRHPGPARRAGRNRASRFAS